LSSEVADLAIAFEARKVSVNQNKDGIILRLSIHPDECPQEIWKDWVGTRYQVAMVQVGDDESPTAHPDTIEANRAIAAAGMLCRDETFQAFLSEHVMEVPGDTPEELQAATVEVLRNFLGIQSRAEMKDNKDALKKFMELRDQYMDWMRS